MRKQEKRVQMQLDAREKRRKLRIRRTKKLFIEATQELISQHGIENLSIRKLSDLTGFGSATLYSYFEDFDELIVFASLKYRRDYVKELSREVREEMNALDQYEKVYETFNAYSFAQPKLFMNMYFGGHSYRIEEIFDEYYEFYPEEETLLPDFLYEALEKRNLYRCDQVFARRLAEQKFIRPEYADLLADIIVRLQQTFLYEMTVHPELDHKVQNEKFMEMFHHVISHSAPEKPF